MGLSSKTQFWALDELFTVSKKVLQSARNIIIITILMEFGKYFEDYSAPTRR